MLAEATFAQQLASFLNRSRTISKNGYYITRALNTATDNTDDEEYFMEERRLFNSKVMWEMLPRDRLGINSLVEALSGAFTEHLAKTGTIIGTMIHN